MFGFLLLALFVYWIAQDLNRSRTYEPESTPEEKKMEDVHENCERCRDEERELNRMKADKNEALKTYNELDKYSKTRKCCKCGHTKKKDQYDIFSRNIDKDVIVRECQNCGYRWSERPLDS